MRRRVSKRAVLSSHLQDSVGEALARLALVHVEEASLTRLIRAHIDRVLAACSDSRTIAAVVLGMHRRTLQRILANEGDLVRGGFSGPNSSTATRGKESRMSARNALEDRINHVVSQAAKEIAAIVRSDVQNEVQRILAGRSAAATKGGPTPKRKRGAGLEPETLAKLLGVIKRHPGLRSEQIYAKISLPVDLARKALARLRDDKRVKTRGQKRAMAYSVA